MVTLCAHRAGLLQACTEMESPELHYINVNKMNKLFFKYFDQQKTEQKTKIQKNKRCNDLSEAINCS